LTARFSALRLILDYRSIRVNLTTIFVFHLSPSEKLQLVEDLSEDLASTLAAIPVYEWQKEELARRETNLRKDPGSGLTWEEVKRRVRHHYGR
jgi:putative addiction module component (TIGR02574 family)